MPKLISLLVSLLVCFTITAQGKDSSWKTLKTYESNAYTIKLPRKWIDRGHFGSVVDRSFDARQLYFPDTFNYKPVTTGVFILNQPSTSLEDAKAECLREYRSNPDRLFESSYIDTVEKVQLTSGQTAYLAHTRFFTPSTQLNQSRYDLIVYTEKKKLGYIIMVSIQYDDNSYSFETDNNLMYFAKQVFNSFSLK